MGVRAFWEWFKRNNEKQRKSIADVGKDSGKVKVRPQKYHATQGAEYRYKVRPWISWREVRAYDSAQETNQLGTSSSLR